MYTVYFLNSKNVKREIGKANTEEEANKIIQQFLDAHNFKSYYSRYWYCEEENGTMVDVGSHTEFFIIEGLKK